MAAPRRVLGRAARLRLRSHARFQPLHGHARRDAGVEPLPQRGARALLAGERAERGTDALMGATEQLQLLFQGHTEAFDRGDVGVARDKDAQKVWHDGMREAMKRLEPSRVLLYGKNIGFDFGGCEVVEYKSGGFHGR